MCSQQGRSCRLALSSGSSYRTSAKDFQVVWINAVTFCGFTASSLCLAGACSTGNISRTGRGFIS